MTIEFEDIEVVSENGLVKVVLEYIGEGYSGDYDPEDQDDTPLLRYTLYRKNDGNENLGNVVEDIGNEWCSVMDGSYCTNLSVHDGRDKLTQVANSMLLQVKDGLTFCVREKRLYEWLSHFSVE
ncbi:MAG: hypothetical protein ACO29P_09950 [Bacteroidia bacterium]